MKLYAAAAALLFAALSSGALASTINLDFEGLNDGPVAQSQGFLLDGNGGQMVFHTDGDFCVPACAANGTDTLMLAGTFFGNASSMTLTRVGGGQFALSGFDAGEMFRNISVFGAPGITYTGSLAGNTVLSGSFTFDGINDGPGGLNDFQHVDLLALTVDTFIFSGMGALFNGFQLDHLNLELPPPAAQVPEPGSLALGALALLGCALARRRPS